MRLLIVGADSNYAIERPYVKYIGQNRQVAAIDFFKAQNQFLEYYNVGIVHKILYRLGVSRILYSINRNLKERIASFKPSVILIFKGMEVFPATLQWIKKQNIKLVNYNPDNPFIFTGKGSGNKNLRDSISLYDLHLTYQEDIKRRLESEYSIPSKLLPFGFELSDDVYQQATAEEEICKMCFVGTPDKYRARFLHQLAIAGVAMDVYGHGWTNFIEHPLITIYHGVFDDDFWKVLRKYRVQLNMMRPHNPTSHNMRTFEIPAVGGIQLAIDTPDHRLYFEAGKEIVLYSDLDNCVNRIKETISWTKDRADSIRDAARKRSLTSGYSYRERSNEIVETLRQLINE